MNMKGDEELVQTKAKRCEHCGGTMWLDGDVVKCFMCSRPVKVEGSDEGMLSRWGQPKLPGSEGRHIRRRDR